MDNTYINQEYCARYGIKHANGSTTIAQQLAEAKYRSIVGRGLLLDEIKGLQHLIDEINEWSAAKAYVISAA